MKRLKDKVRGWFGAGPGPNRPAADPGSPPIPVPFHINLELTTACNYACRYCAVSASSYRAHKLNRRDAFELVDDLARMDQAVGVIQLSGHGESTILPWFEDLIVHIRRKIPSVSLCFHTNGSNLDRHAGTLVEQKVDNISISVDGASAGVFDAIRGEGSFARLVDGLTRVSREKAIRRVHTPYLSFVVTLLKDNVFELPGIVAMAHHFGVHKVITQPLTPYDELGTRDLTLGSLGQRQRTEARTAVTRARQAAEDQGIEFHVLNQDPFNEPVTEWHLAMDKEPVRATDADAGHDPPPSRPNAVGSVPDPGAATMPDAPDPGPGVAEGPGQAAQPIKRYRLCTDPWKILYINARGGFDTCCFRHDDVTETLQDSRLEDVWYRSEGLNRVRGNLLQGTLDEVCAGCTVRPESDHPPEIPAAWVG